MEPNGIRAVGGGHLIPRAPEGCVALAEAPKLPIPGSLESNVLATKQVCPWEEGATHHILNATPTRMASDASVAQHWAP